MDKPKQRRTPQQILSQAADLLDNSEVGWTQGSLFRQNGSKPCMCVLGAIAYCSTPAVKKLVDEGGQLKSAMLNANWLANKTLHNPTTLAARSMRQLHKQLPICTDDDDAMLDVEFFNDDIAIRKSKVVNALRKAAKKEECTR